MMWFFNGVAVRWSAPGITRDFFELDDRARSYMVRENNGTKASRVLWFKRTWPKPETLTEQGRI